MTDQLNIAHVLQWFELGGGETLAGELAARQVARGHRVCVVALAAGGPLQGAFQERGVEALVINKRPGLDFTLPPRLLKFFRARQAALVHTHDPQSLVYASVAGRLAGASVVHTKHGETIERARRHFLRRMAAHWVNAFVAVSESTAQTAMRRSEVGPEKIRVITNGVDVERFSSNARARAEVRDELGIDAGAWVVGAVGRLVPEKHHALLFRAMAPLLDGGQTHLVIAGDGTCRPDLCAIVDAWPPSRRTHVHLLGERRDVARLLAGFDVFALSSRSEGLPLAVLEAMASGLPVVATAVGGLSSLVINEVTGILVPPDDPDQLRKGLLAMSNRRDRARAMGAAARETITRRYSLDQMADRYMDVYRGALAGRPS